MKDRARLWNEVELIELRKDSQTAREIDLALPKELARERQIELIRNFATSAFVVRGMVADVAMHDKGDGNPHAHIMLTMRTIEPDGFGKKAVEWNDRSLLGSWRKEWQDEANRALEHNGHEARIDHRTLRAQNIEREPTQHLGPAGAAMVKRGLALDKAGGWSRTERGREERMIGKEKQANFREFLGVNAELNGILTAERKQEEERKQQREQEERMAAAQEARRQAAAERAAERQAKRHKEQEERLEQEQKELKRLERQTARERAEKTKEVQGEPARAQEIPAPGRERKTSTPGPVKIERFVALSFGKDAMNSPKRWNESAVSLWPGSRPNGNTTRYGSS